MASTFDNDLRLEEMATGENAGSWGTKTNTNLELIADAFGYGTFTIADADTTLTMPDGSDTDNALRSLYLKISSSADLTTTRVLTLAPNTVSKLWYIENNTSGGQTITISQGSGVNVSILNGQAKLVATDGAGAGAAVIDATQDLAIPDLFIDDDLSLQSDGAIINFGADADVNLTHVADTGLRLNDAMALEFRDGDLSINSSADGQLDIDADTKIEITSTNVDIDGIINVGEDDTGYDVKFFGATSGKYMLWDESADTLAVEGDLTVDTNTLYVDSTNDRVGIGTSSPASTLDVTGTVRTDQLTVYNGTSDPDVLFRNNGTGDVTLTFRRGAADDVYTDWSLINDSGTFTFISDNSSDPDHTQLTMNQGDISFYDTSGNAKFFWDASAEVLGIGTTSPNVNSQLNVSSASGEGSIRIDGGTNTKITSIAANTGSNFIYFGDADSFQSGFVRYQHSDDLLTFKSVDAINFVTSGLERMRVTSAGDIGIGTSSPSGPFHVVDGRDELSFTNASNNVYLSLTAGYNTKNSVINFYNTSDAGYGRIDYDHATEYMAISTNSAEAARFDSSGNLLVGTTVNSIDTEGALVRSTGQISACVDDSYGAVFQRKTSDGDIALFRKDGTTVGSIGSHAGFVTMGSGDTSLIFDSTANTIEPFNQNDRTSEDDAVTLGWSSNRFKDLYLSGGVYLGGTGSANYLDDYETGTWTPTFSAASGSFSSLPYSSDSRFGRYTIVGNRCYFEIKLQTNNLGVSTGTASGNLYVNLPFTAATVTNYSNKAAAAVSYSAYFSSQVNPSAAEVAGGTTNLFFWHRATGTSVPTVVQASDVDTTTGGTYNRVRVFGHYELA